MIARYTASFSSASLVTFGLLFIMQFLIATGETPYSPSKVLRFVNFVRVERTPVPSDTVRDPEVRPPEVEPRPPMPQIDNTAGGGIVVQVYPGRLQTHTLQLVHYSIADGEPLPIVAVAPTYPFSALSRDLEGYVIVEYTVTRIGTVSDVRVVESTSSVFEKAAIDAAYKFKYRPRVINGEPVDVRGIRYKITFVLDR